MLGPGLDALNFALAGAREGFGPFLGVFLQHRGFDPASTGIAMSIAGLAGIAVTTPLGSLIDRTTAKRAAVVAAVAGIAIGAALIVATSSLGLTALGQVIIGVADTSLAPLVAALTLGIVGQQVYSQRVARNEAFNHAGNAVNAALVGSSRVLAGARLGGTGHRRDGGSPVRPWCCASIPARSTTRPPAAEIRVPDPPGTP